MTNGHSRGRPPRTVLEQKIWERGETLAEFVEYAERFARDHGERGTLSERNLKRLIAGSRADGAPISTPRNATKRLLERIFGTNFQDLISAPSSNSDKAGEQELKQMLNIARRVDAAILDLLNIQLTTIRRLDRQFGSKVTRDEVKSKVQQVSFMLTYSLTPTTRRELAAIRAELGALAGWQTLDIGHLQDSWKEYEQAKQAANESGDIAMKAHAATGQAFVLLDLGETSAAERILSTARVEAERSASRLLRAWLAAAHGEALAADGQRTACLRAFDQALRILPQNATDHPRPYVVLNDVHLARWRGHALARIRHQEAASVLRAVIAELDPSYNRARASLLVDFTTALVAQGEYDLAKQQIAPARRLTEEIGSIRQQRRIERLSKELERRYGVSQSPESRNTQA